MNTSAPAPIRTVPGPTDRTRWSGAAEIAGRVLLALLFLVAGLGKISAYAGMAAYMSSFGVPSGVLPIVIAIEVGGAVAIILGWRTRITSLLLAGFSLLTAVIFHRNFGDPIQATMFLKNLSIAGGFLILAANGPGPLSLDRRASKHDR